MKSDQIIALGFFDGVHKGHQQVLRTAVAMANEAGCRSAAVTFETHPRAYVLGISPDIITPFEQRRSLILRQGIDSVIALPFDKQMAETSPEDFAHMLRDKYRCVGVVCGQNFRFGKNASGSPEFLRSMGIDVNICPPVTLPGGGVISSTLIRQLVHSGDMPGAEACLGRRFFIEGDVTHGQQVGRRFGFPTVNTKAEIGTLIPRHGVYATFVTLGGVRYPAVTNVGVRPTFTDADIISIESNLLGFCGSAYGQISRVEFVSYLRGEKAWDSPQSLKDQIEKDKISARMLLEKEDQADV